MGLACAGAPPRHAVGALLREGKEIVRFADVRPVLLSSSAAGWVFAVSEIVRKDIEFCRVVRDVRISLKNETLMKPHWFSSSICYTSTGCNHECKMLFL
mmetsp:Transcript_10130/g.19434  ORF Transcript_10130/g.19434 Transcript_10130/m.19434 type:complete len:99 (-) Transcript_10130:297-593(-)